MSMRVIPILSFFAVIAISRADVLETALANDDACAMDDSGEGCSVEMRQLRGEKVVSEQESASTGESGPSLLEIELDFGTASVCVPSRGCSRNDVCQKIGNKGDKPITGTIACKSCLGDRKCQMFGRGTAFTCGCTVGAMLTEEDAATEQEDAQAEVKDEDEESFIDEDAEGNSDDEDDEDNDADMALTESNADKTETDQDEADEATHEGDADDEQSAGRRGSWFGSPDSPRCCRCKYGKTQIVWSMSGKCKRCGSDADGFFCSIFGGCYAYKRRVKPSATECRNAENSTAKIIPCSTKCRHDV